KIETVPPGGGPMGGWTAVDGAGPGRVHDGDTVRQPVPGPGPSPEADSTVRAPRPEAGHAPRPEAGHAPRPDAGHPPRPDAGHTPRPDTGHTPRPDTGHTPRPDTGQGTVPRPVPPKPTGTQADYRKFVPNPQRHLGATLRYCALLAAGLLTLAVFDGILLSAVA